MVYNKSLFIFRRDLRLHDNTALNQASVQSKKVYPIFIFDDRQIKNNPYKSDHAVTFMIQSLKELDLELQKKKSKVHFFHGFNHVVIEKLIKEHSIEAIFVNTDYTPFSKNRDATIEKICKKNNVSFHSLHDVLLQPPGLVQKSDGTPYTIFTPFWKKAREIPIKKTKTTINNLSLMHSEPIVPIPKTSDSLLLKGGRKEALSILEELDELDDYEKTRDIPSLQGTSLLSAHLKFGTVSVREVFYKIQEKLSENHPLIRQLYWRDFWYYIAFHFPKVFGHAFQEKYDKLPWENDISKFKAWCEGKTGFPIIDAGMRQLNETGYMHNRVRMIVASFLVKDLHIDWKWGEKYFAQKLTDYDPCLNNGNWQWAASTGCDAAPYFRIFNPWLQQKKFDPDTKYIKEWIPELKDKTSKEIHGLEGNSFENYSLQIITHKEEAEKSKALFKSMS